MAESRWLKTRRTRNAWAFRQYGDGVNFEWGGYAAPLKPRMFFGPNAKRKAALDRGARG